ncbi:MAG: indolepyruvate ferredoxin oxidoreductase family protein [Acidimicrobiales bacterium]
MVSTEFQLSDRLGAISGTVAMSGVQALLRVTADQHRADAARGLRTSGLIAGYRGSPLGGVEDVYEQNRTLLQRNRVEFISGVNEDLAATMVWGSQLAHLQDDFRHDGVFGLWYGKGPGIDRSLDAMRHANFSGVDPKGGVLAAVGDDPACKSSTIPSASEGVLADLGMPVLYPSSVQDVLDLGRWGYELSRVCGSWVGMKIHTEVADQYSTVDVGSERIGQVVRPDLDGWSPVHESMLIAPANMAAEVDLFGMRVEAARRFVAANSLDRVAGATEGSFGIVAAGKAHADVISALSELGLGTEQALRAAGVRVLRPAMIWPLEPTGLRQFVEGLDEVFIVEEKRPFIESQVRELLFDVTVRPRVTGKKAPDGSPLVPLGGSLTGDDIVGALRARLEANLGDLVLRPRRERISVHAGGELPTRSPFFCSGCPHNRSTVVPEGSVAGGGIGCHTMTAWMDRSMDGYTQMGGEGAQWVGMSPFVESVHRFQNLGDGTLFHSGSLAIRQSVAARANVTYKILYNGTVAMTGGQDAAGAMEVPELTRYLEAEGVVETVVITEDSDRYRGNFASNTSVTSRDEFDEAQLRLREVPGVTAIVYDQRCAAELRRDRKRGVVATPTKRIFINEAVCDGCGDCGRVSNCMSVHPVSSPFGRKTRIHQESCNYDYSCVEGNCPAFIAVDVDPESSSSVGRTVEVGAGEMPSDPDTPTEATLLIVGIGGTGVVTVSQLLSTAALLDGRQAASLDQTGLAQKGGRVISHLRISDALNESAPRLGDGEADALLIFDLIGGSNADVLSKARPGRTRAVVSNARLPTGPMVKELGHEFPELEDFRQALESATGADLITWLDAEGIARSVFGSQPAANLMVVGIAYQQGLVPVSAAAIESAIVHNGVAVEMNTDAFRLGRRMATDPVLLADLESRAASRDFSPSVPEGRAAQLLGEVSGSERLLELMRWRVPELIEYQDSDYARTYVDVVKRCRAVEKDLGLDCALSEVVAFQLFKLMAYKDEYEVARLHLRDGLNDEIGAQFGEKVSVSFMLAPPTLKRFGRDSKTAVPAGAAKAMFKALVKAKRLRGTRFDPFGGTEERRIERELAVGYPQLVDRVLDQLGPANAHQAVRLLELADQVRGFDTVKLANVANYRAEVAAALAAYEAGSET